MAKVSLKREIAGILETAMPCGTIVNDWNTEQTQHRATSGNFTCTFATDHLNSREEVVEWLAKKAESMFRKPSKKVDRGLDFQKALLYISEHREVIPLVKFLREKCDERKKVKTAMNEWVNKYVEKFGSIPSYVKPYYYPGFSKLHYIFMDNRSPESLYEVADMIPKAWMPN